MLLKAPLIITSRLLPGLKVGDTTISVEPTEFVIDGHVSWTIFLDGPATYSFPASLSTGAQYSADGEGAYAAISAVISFLSNDAELYQHYGMGAEVPPDGYSFNSDVAEWSYQYSSELNVAAMELNPEDYS